MKIQLRNTVPGGADMVITLEKVRKNKGDRPGEAKQLKNGQAVLSVDLSKGATAYRTAGGMVAQWLAGRPCRRPALDVTKLGPVDDNLAALTEGLVLGSFQFTPYRAPDRKAAGAVTIVSSSAAAAPRRAVERAVAVAEAVNLARSWGHEPANVINPVTLAARCRKLATACGLKCKVITDAELKRMKANGIVQVGIGSKTPSRLILLEYAGKGAAKSAPVALVGKAITFDTGGYSLKNTTGIVGMKYDKCGGMAVIGTMRALAALKPAIRVVGVIAAAENMISGEAYRPNDIIKMLNGKTVEIISTDAEGRLVLADALAYAEKTYKPSAMIDLATLTGGVVVALGDLRGGLMFNDRKLADALQASGDRTDERVWPLPLDDEYLDLIRGDDSDLKNSGGRHAHAIIGGTFLKQFVASTPWAHLDIAGVATSDKDTPICPHGATGFGVRLLVDYLTKRG